MRKFTFILIALVGLCACTPSPKSVVKSYLTAIQDNDYDKAKAYTNANDDDWEVYEEYFRSSDFRIDKFEISNVEVDKDWGLAYMDVKLTGNIYGDKTYDSSYSLDLTDGTWIIDMD